MWAGWIYELEAAKWDLDLDRTNLAAKFRIAYWSSLIAVNNPYFAWTTCTMDQNDFPLCPVQALFVLSGGS